MNANAIPHATDPFPELRKIVTLPEVSFNTGAAATAGGGGGAADDLACRRDPRLALGR